MKYFKNPVSMRVTQEQFERDLRKPLEELGAKFCCIAGFTSYPILASNSSGESGIIENFLECDKLNFNRHFIEAYDPEQFIAICKLEVNMIVGECYTVLRDNEQKMIGYLLENNRGNNKNRLWGYFKGLGFLGYFFEKWHINYSSESYTIRLSTPEEKAKLDKVIAEQTEVKSEIILTDSEITPYQIKVIDKVKSDLKQTKKKVKLLTEVLKYLENGI